MTAHSMFDVFGATGSSRGIGFALARGLLSAGVSVALNARDPERLDAAVAELTPVAEKNDARVYAAPFDVTDPEAVRRGVARVEDPAGPLDILVNNTGAQRTHIVRRHHRRRLAPPVGDQPDERLPRRPRGRTADGGAALGQDRQHLLAAE